MLCAYFRYYTVVCVVVIVVVLCGRTKVVKARMEDGSMRKGSMMLTRELYNDTANLINDKRNSGANDARKNLAETITCFMHT